MAKLSKAARRIVDYGSIQTVYIDWQSAMILNYR
jgi:hypothetical protein